MCAHLQVGGVEGGEEAAGLPPQGIAQRGRLAAAEGLPGAQDGLRPLQHLRKEPSNEVHLPRSRLPPRALVRTAQGLLLAAAPAEAQGAAAGRRPEKTRRAV